MRLCLFKGDPRLSLTSLAGLIENLISLTPQLAAPFLSSKNSFLQFLVDRLAEDKKPVEYEQNRFYAAEMLALVLSLPPEVVAGVDEARYRVGKDGWMDQLLKVLSVRAATMASSALRELTRELHPAGLPQA